MSITVQSRKILWGRSGNRCAYPGCNQELHQVIEQNNTVIGEECHIEARSCEGPRFNSNLSEVQINSFENLILMCPIHHRIIDDNPNEYTVSVLKKMKADHESRVRQALEDKSEFDDLYYMSIVDYIDMMMDFENWDAWTSYLLSAEGPMCTKEKQESIEEVKQFILSRIWYKRYPDFEIAIRQFRFILDDFDNIFHKHSDLVKGWYKTEKFYKVRPYDYEIADRMLSEYETHVILIDNLVYEMTRAANLICDLTRRYVNPSYRLAEGKLLSYDKCPEYREGEYYPGLEKFKEICETRDVYIQLPR